MALKIEMEGNRANLYVPYNQDFIERLKHIAGRRWDPARKLWSIPAASLPDCRQIMEEVYGETDIAPCRKIKLQLTFRNSVHAEGKDVLMFGKTLSHAWNRDSGGICGEDVSYVKKMPDSGGSAKRWDSVVPEGAVLILHEVAEPLYLRFEGSSDVQVEVLQPKKEKQEEAKPESAELKSPTPVIPVAVAVKGKDPSKKKKAKKETKKEKKKKKVS